MTNMQTSLRVKATLPAWAMSFALAAICGLTGPASAKPTHKAAVTSYYGDLLRQEQRNCNLCHLSDDEISAASADSLGDELQPWNAFGRSLAELGPELEENAAGTENIVERVRQLADADADGDGVGNELEIAAGRSPADAADRPTDAELEAASAAVAKFRSTQPLYAWRPTAAVVRPEVPCVEGDWASNAIDAFVAAEHHRQGLTPQPQAAKEVLLRRVTIDLTGLPPTRRETEAFLADDSPDAYANAVDRLLASPLYGERWGRHWMDIWRYSDWAGWGDQVRDSHPHIWRWRDWIVESLNADKSYDAMVTEMLAADELKPGDADSLRATGFLVRNFKLLSREQWMLDAVDHTSRAFLGVTFKCAQCHDHLYDPLLHEEYFQFRAVFEPYKVRVDPLPSDPLNKMVGLARVFDADPQAKTLFYLRGDERSPDPDRKIEPGLPEYLNGGPLEAEPIDLPADEYAPGLQTWVVDPQRAKLASAHEASERALADSQREGADAAAVDLAKAKRDAASAELAAFEARLASDRAKHIPAASTSDRPIDAEELKRLSREASGAERRGKLAVAEVAVLEARGTLRSAEQSSGEDREKKVAEASAAVAKAEKARDEAAAAAAAESDAYTPLGEVYPAVSSGRRLALARWIVARENPLAARVAVNHLWARHFGRGLVETVDDFGQNGRRPAHPALLDWLAAELMEPSRPAGCEPPRPWSMKHIHRLIVLSSTYRLASDYDAASAAADPENRFFWRTTPRRVEAESVRDAVLHLAGGLDLGQGGPEIDHTKAMQVPRRSLYFRHAAEKQTQFLQIFDMAAPTECYLRRDSVIPQQALALANSELSVTQSRRLTRTLARETEAAGEDFIDAAFLQVLGRMPNDAERAECESFLAEQQRRLAEVGGEGASDLDDVSKPAADATLRARENLVHVLFNHHEFVTLR